MNREQIQKVEEELNIKLPYDYKQFQINYPKELIDLKFNNEYFIDDADYLIKLNTQLRGGNMPKNYLAIGYDIGGNFFFIDLNDSKSSVYYLDHEDASDTVNSTPVEFKDHLTLNSNSLNDFQDWLANFWGDTLLSLKI